MRPTKSSVARKQDELHLMILHLCENEGWSFGQVAKHLGLTRSAVSGVHRRVRVAYEFWCECDKPENKDGGMEPLWWKEPKDGAQ